MKKHFALAGAFAAALFLQNGFAPSATAQRVPPPHTTLKEGDMAPDFTLTATDGSKVTLSSFRGKNVVVLAFYPAAFTGG
jgi:cytochrome oxidase Cu insertion factor (SCO1/SenC/PrrC family)